MQKRRKNRLLLFKNGEVKMRKVIKIFIIFTIGFNCIACNPKHNDYSISVIDTSSTTNKSQITFNLKNNKFKTINSNICIKSMAIKNNSLYTVDSLNYIYKFDLLNDMKLVKKIKHTPPKNMYLSTIAS